MADDAGRRRRIKLESDAQMAVWVAGRLFTVGYLHLHFWRAVFALVIWPYYLGVALR